MGYCGWLTARTGRPPRWTPPNHLETLPPDRGQYFRDRNAAQYPKHPIEPAALVALNALNKSVGDHQVDIFACSSTLGNLLRFVRGCDRPFRMLVEVVEGTVFFIRRENTPTELIQDVSGFGHTFPEHYTSWDEDTRGSVSHQRLLRYDFGGLKFLLRFEADGYIAKKDPEASERYFAKAAEDSVSLADLLVSLDSAGVSPSTESPEKELLIRPAGSLVDQSLIFDLKTRSVRKKQEDTLSEVIPRLWVAQIKKFILAYHEYGLFNDIRILDVSSELRDWEESQQDALSKLAALIHRITGLVRKELSGKLELCYSRVDVLEIREQLPDAGNALSPAVRALWTAPRTTGNSKPAKEDRDKREPGSDLKYSSDFGKSGNSDQIVWADEPKWDFTACSESCGYCGRHAT
jgi:hypothetical protein